MKFLIFLALAVACANADVSHLAADAAATIARSTYEISPEGSFQYAYETSNGIVSEANGVVKNPNSDNPTLEVQGSSRYTSPEGVVNAITYVANEFGYQPQGDSIPVGPAIPEYITRSLRYIAEHPAQETRAAANAVYASLG